jgi:hypothetical protein
VAKLDHGQAVATVPVRPQARVRSARRFGRQLSKSPLHTLPMPTIQHRPRRGKARLPLLLVLFALAAWGFRPKPYDPKMGLADYEQLRLYLGKFYANLDWSVAQGRTDLLELHNETYRALARARSQEQAARILHDFVEAFGDPHMTLLWAGSPPLDPPPSTEKLSRSTPPARACAALSFTYNSGGFAFTLDSQRGFRRLRGWNSFPAALLDTEGQRFGLLRIGSFNGQDYLGACLREWPRFSQALSGNCEEECQHDFRVSVDGRLLRELAWQVRRLRQAGAGALLVDVTDNNGGYRWYRRAAQILAPGPVRPFRAALVKSSDTAESLYSKRRRILEYLATHQVAPAERAAFDDAFCRLDDLIAEAEQPCSAGALWKGEPSKFGCSRLTTRPLFGTGLFEEDPGLTLPFGIAQVLYVDHAYPRLPSAWSGPVIVLVDEGAASAAELFAATLKFSAGAVVIGRHTASGGGGWRLGRTSWTLLRTGMQLYLPDSVEYWPDGTNAREGLEPDIKMMHVPPSSDDPHMTAAWLFLTLPQLVVPPAER